MICALYARKSTVRAGESDKSDSVERQLAGLRVNFCADHVLNEAGQRATTRYPLRRLAATVPRKWA